MDLSTVLTWVIGTECVLALAMIWRLHRTRFPGWLGVHALSLVILGVGHLVVPEIAGLLAAAVWTPLVLAPILGRRLLQTLASHHRYRAAVRLARVLGWLHPMDGWREVPRLLEASALAQSGDREGARRRLVILRAEDGPMARESTLRLCRMDGRWEELILLVDTHPGRENLLREPNVLTSYARALGETGRIEEMVALHGAHVEPLGRSLGSRWLTNARLVTAAFAGRIDQVRTIIGVPRAPVADDVRAFWLATALQAAGRVEEAEPLLREVASSGDPLTRPAAERRLQSPVRTAEPEALSQPAHGVLDAMAADARELMTYGSLTEPPVGPAPRATWALVGLNVVAYLFEIPGGTTDPANLLSLGALLAPADLLEGQWWRAVTAAFLHFGLAHLAMNMVALWYFGRYLERVLGTLRFVLLYAVAAPLSMALITLVATWRGAEHHIIVGASGGVMALLGAIIAVLWLRWRLQRAPVAGRDLLILLAMLAFQTAFDVFTPQVSFVGHAAGASLGFAFGLLLAPRRDSDPN